MREIRICQYRNDDDGDDTAWCIQSFSKCDEEKLQKCSESKLLEE